MPRFFSWGKVNQIKAEVKNLVSDKPKIYDVIRLLRVELRAEADEVHSEEILNALRQLDARLDEIQRKFNRQIGKGVNVIEYAIYVREFAHDCRSALYSYEPTLMTAPGFVNKFKAYLNMFMERFLEIEAYFQPEKSTLGLKEDFRKQFNTAKDELMPQPDPEECSCIPGFF
jgi:hypothetical protein